MMGFYIAFFCACLATSKDLVSKKLAAHVDGSVSAFASFVFALPYYLVLLFLLYLAGVETFAVSGAFWTLVLLRSVTDTAAEWLKMNAFIHGDISLVACFFALVPAFVLMISPLITGDRIPIIGVFGVLIIVIGSLMLIYKPRTAEESVQAKEERLRQRKGAIFAAAAAIFFAINTCFDRLAVQVASATFSAFAMTVLSALFLSPLVLFVKSRKQEMLIHSRTFFLRGFFEIACMVTKLLSLQYLQAPYVAGMLKLSLIFSIIGGRFLYKEEDFSKRLFAGAIILFGILIIVLAETIF